MEVFSKEDFPGSRVYGNTGYAELRVITCGGGYSKARGYDGNVVVFARMVRSLLASGGPCGLRAGRAPAAQRRGTVIRYPSSSSFGR